MHMFHSAIKEARLELARSESRLVFPGWNPERASTRGSCSMLYPRVRISESLPRRLWQDQSRRQRGLPQALPASFDQPRPQEDVAPRATCRAPSARSCRRKIEVRLAPDPQASYATAPSERGSSARVARRKKAVVPRALSGRLHGLPLQRPPRHLPIVCPRP